MQELRASGWHLYFSNRGSRRKGPGVRGALGGVTIALRPEFAKHAARAEPPDRALLGHVLELNLHLPAGQHVVLLGVYMPTDVRDATIADAVMDYIASRATACAANNTHFLCGGDFNAALCDLDRRNGRTTRDNNWRARCQHAALAPIAPPLLPHAPGGPPSQPYAREHTFCPPGAQRHGGTSRIDDWLSVDASPLAAAAQTPCLHGQATGVLRDFQHTTDHAPVACVLDLHAIGSARPVAYVVPREAVMHRPTDATKKAFKAAVNAYEPAPLHARIRALLTQASVSRADVESLDAELRTWIQCVVTAAFEACGSYVPSSTDAHRTRKASRRKSNQIK
jgi:hypothetical protein